MARATLLTLPLELRFQIYDYLHQDDEKRLNQSIEACKGTIQLRNLDSAWICDSEVRPCKSLIMVVRYKRSLAALSDADAILGKDILNYKVASQIASTRDKYQVGVLSWPTRVDRSCVFRLRVPCWVNFTTLVQKSLTEALLESMMGLMKGLSEDTHQIDPDHEVKIRVYWQQREFPGNTPAILNGYSFDFELQERLKRMLHKKVNAHFKVGTRIALSIKFNHGSPPQFLGHFKIPYKYDEGDSNK